MQAAADKIRLWREKPQAFVREVFNATPDPWQDDVLEVFPHKPRIAMKACKGPGKTCLLSWLCWNFLLTRPHPKIAATAVSGENLRDNLWTEMATWQARSPLLQETFSWHAERIISKEHPETWWMSARAWSRSAKPEQQGNTLAGLHAPYVMIVLDESGGIPDAVMANAEGIGASAIEWHIVQAGNPTHLEGPLYRACSNERDLWYLVEITADPDNPKRTSRVPVQWAREQIQKYGADNPWVLVNVFGQFPPASLNSLIGPDEVNAALGRQVPRGAYSFAAKVLGIDVADFGDDRSVVIPRQGLVVFKPLIMRNVNPEHGAGSAARMWMDWNADGAFIDNSGGWASGWKVVLRQLGRTPIEVDFAGKANDPKYFNKRAEIWFEMCEDIKRGLALPADLTEIVPELTTPTYTFKGDKFMLEPKEQIKARLGRSPDIAEALATTYAQPIHVTLRNELGLPMNQAPAQAQHEYDPYNRD